MEKTTVSKELLFDKERELLKEEYANLRNKQKNGFMNSVFFRKNIFNASSRGERIQYKKPKVVWEQTEIDKVAITHSLHQRHADVLSLLHTDNLGVSKPEKDGSYTISVSLYRIAKFMGYKEPHKRTDDVKQFIDELRWTDFVQTDCEGDWSFPILGETLKTKEGFFILISGKSAKILAHTTGIKFNREITHKIVNIPNRLPKIKALVRFVLSNKPTKNGYTLEYFYDKFNIGLNGSIRTIRNQKAKFKKELKENEELLNMFNISYDRSQQKIYYLAQLKEITFELSAPKFTEVDLQEHQFLCQGGGAKTFTEIGKYIKLDALNQEKEMRYYKIVDITESEQQTQQTEEGFTTYIVHLLDIKSKKKLGILASLEGLNKHITFLEEEGEEEEQK